MKAEDFTFAGFLNEAEAVLKFIHVKFPDNPGVKTEWDEEAGSMKSESLESAIHAYRRAVEKMPENTAFMGNLGEFRRALSQSCCKWRREWRFSEELCLENPFSEIFPANLVMAHESLHTPSDTLQ